MERRSQNLTPLQRHLLTLLAKPRPGQIPPWLSLEPDGVRVEPLAQLLRGRGALVAAKGLKATGWLRSRAGGGLELALAVVEVTEVLEGSRRPSRESARAAEAERHQAELVGVLERAVANSLTFTGVALPAPVSQP